MACLDCLASGGSSMGPPRALCVLTVLFTLPPAEVMGFSGSPEIINGRLASECRVCRAAAAAALPVGNRPEGLAAVHRVSCASCVLACREAPHNSMCSCTAWVPPLSTLPSPPPPLLTPPPPHTPPCAVLGFVAALGAELSSGDSIVKQLSEEPTLIGLTFVLFSAGSLVPAFARRTSDTLGPFTPQAEMLNGRAAMIGECPRRLCRPCPRPGAPAWRTICVLSYLHSSLADAQLPNAAAVCAQPLPAAAPTLESWQS